MLTAALTLIAPFPALPAGLRYIEKGDTLGTYSHSIQAADVAQAASWFYGAVTSQITTGAGGFVVLAAKNNSFTGNNTFAGSSTFNGAVTLAGTTTVPGGSIFDIDGSLEIDDGGSLQVTSSGSMAVNGPASWNTGGTLTMGSESIFTAAFNSLVYIDSIAEIRSGGFFKIDSGGTLEVKAGASFDIRTNDAVLYGSAKLTCNASSTVDVYGNCNIQSGGVLDCKSSGLVRVRVGANLQCDGGSAASFAGPANFTDNVNLTGASILADAATTSVDSSTITRKGPTILDDDNAYVGERGRLNHNATSDLSIDAYKYEVINLTAALGGDIDWYLMDPPGEAKIRLVIRIAGGLCGTHNLDIKDSASTTIIRFDGLSNGDVFKAVMLRYNSTGSPKWTILLTDVRDLSGSPPVL